MHRQRGHHVAIYGNISIPRRFCTKCLSTAFVFDGKLACCDSGVRTRPDRVVRVTSPEQARRLASRKERREQLEKQGHRCLYCEREFNSVVVRVKRNGDSVRQLVTLVWDHYAPFVYSQDNHARNFVAACSTCNGIKSSRMFQDVEEARAYVMARRVHKGYV